MMQKIIGPSSKQNTDSMDEEEDEEIDEEPLTKKGTPEKRPTKTTPEN